MECRRVECTRTRQPIICTPSNKTALVLCGGGAQGAAEVGFYQTMVEQGVKPDFIIGTSIGAINGAFIASGLDISQFKRTMERNFRTKTLPVQSCISMEMGQCFKFV